MNVNFYQKYQKRTLNDTPSHDNSILFLDYLESFLANTSTKRVQGYGNIGLAHNTIRTYESLYRIVKTYETDILKKLYLGLFHRATPFFL